jgi:hypothetical protein
MRRTLLLLVGFFATPGWATLSTCNPAQGPPPSPTLTVLQISSATLRFTFTNGFTSDSQQSVTVGVVAVAVFGNEVRVTQPFSDVLNPIEVPPVVFALCQVETFDIPALPPGNYTLRWTYSPTAPSSFPPEVTLPFSVPAPSVPALGGWELTALAAVLAALGATALRR